MKNIIYIISLISLIPGIAFSEISGHSHEHQEETCFICDASKRDKDRLWCRGHARYEDRCWLCHPELENKERPYCGTHYLYEDECHLCHPELGVAAVAEQEPSDDDYGNDSTSHRLFCNEHGVPEIECGICQPQLAAELTPGESLKIRMPSTASAERAGVETGEVDRRQARPVIESLCEIQYNLNSLAKVTPLADGIILSVLHDVGDNVQAGDVLAVLHSAAVANGKSAFLSASVDADIKLKSYEREKRLWEQNIASEKEFLEAEAAYRTAMLEASSCRQKLINLGLAMQEIDEVSRNLDTSAVLPVRAPFDGTIVERSAVMGEAAPTGDPLFTVADLSSFWLALSIPADFIGRIETGQPVEARFPELPGEVLKGRIIWIDTSVDPRSRMIRARAIVEQSEIQLRSGLYGQAYIGAESVRPMSLLPRDAIHQHEGESYVFVKEEPDLFALRRVSTGVSIGNSVEVSSGLMSGESVVIKGGFVVMSEFLKSRLGAGCAGH